MNKLLLSLCLPVFLVPAAAEDAPAPAAPPAPVVIAFDDLADGEIPESFLSTDQEAKFAIAGDKEGKFLELAGQPIVDGGLLLGKSIKGAPPSPRASRRPANAARNPASASASTASAARASASSPPPDRSRSSSPRTRRRPSPPLPINGPVARGHGSNSPSARTRTAAAPSKAASGPRISSARHSRRSPQPPRNLLLRARLRSGVHRTANSPSPSTTSPSKRNDPMPPAAAGSPWTGALP